MKRQFRVIPVLDLIDGFVVRGIRGERDKYLPVQSTLTASSEYGDVLAAFYQGFGLSEFYIADLDALISGGKRNQFGLLGQRQVINIPGLAFMVDAGVHDGASVKAVCQTGVEKVIAGTETLPSFKALREMLQAVDEPRCLVASIDTKAGKVISSSAEIADLTPAEVIREISKTGIRDFILLQLAQVGTGGGLDKPLIQDCLRALRDIKGDSASLLVGGGISGYEDLRWLADHGLDGALVASALHDKQLTPGAMRELQQND